ncbi:MAG: Holliday junction branch migration DNA helicase RuvB [Candidatus Omnitrophota bacterium]
MNEKSFSFDDIISQKAQAGDLTSRRETDEDVILNISLRPSSLNEFIGQKEMVENLRLSITAARQRQEPLEHVLLCGPPGLGKTCLASIVAHEMESKITSTSGPAIERAGDLIGILTNLEEGDVLFIDEIHRLSKVVEEFLYPAMENFQIDFVIDKGPYARTIKFNLKRFTLVGATTRSGLIGSPLRSRFGILHHFDFYREEDLSRIVKRSASLLGIAVEEEGALEIARRARGTPRIANRLLRRVRDYAQVKSSGKITRGVADQALSDLGIDPHGLDEADRKVLKTILTVYQGGPVGIETLAATLNEEPDTIIDTIEPYLLKAGFLKRTSRGREATDLARQIKIA